MAWELHLWFCWGITATAYQTVMGKSILIDSHCRIAMINFDSVPQLHVQPFSYMHYFAARSRHGSHSHIVTFTRFSIATHCTDMVLYHDKTPCPFVDFIEVIILAWCLRLCVGFLLESYGLVRGTESNRIYVFYFAESPITSIRLIKNNWVLHQSVACLGLI